jgi:hypothetical protein
VGIPQIPHDEKRTSRDLASAKLREYHDSGRLIEEMPLEYKKTFNPGENLWPVAVKLSQSDVAQRPNTEIVSCKECGEQFGIQNAIAAIRPMQQLKDQLEQWLSRDHSDERRHQDRYEFRF